MIDHSANSVATNRRFRTAVGFRAGLGIVSLAATLMGASNRSSAEGPGFVDASRVVPDLAVDMRYAGSHNFTGRPVPGYEAPRCLLTPQAAKALASVQVDLQRQGLGLKVFDCYRPARAVVAFTRWVLDPSETGEKAEFYPDLDKSALIRLGYIGARSTHSSGSTVDLTMQAGGGDVDMGTGFDLFGPRAWSAARGLTPEQTANRLRLRTAMARHGFVPYRREWWHFTLAADPHRGVAYDVPITP